MRDVMLDLETLGTKPGCSILSIGAVFFDPRGVGVGETFYRNINSDSCFLKGLTADQSTVNWWNKQSQSARDALKVDQVSLEDALFDFVDWFNSNSGECVWAQGASFDPPILEKAFELCDIKTPWKFWNIRDTRTVYDVFNFNVKKVERLGTHHNALEDCKHQVECVQRAITV